MGFFQARGLVPKLPSPFQFDQGLGLMRPVYLSESPRERARSRTTLLGQVPIRVGIQVAYCPVMLRSSSGLDLSARQLVRHLLCVYHEDAFLGYDLQLLRSHPGGLAQLRTEAQRVLDGTTRWSGILRRVVGDPDYHRGLIGLAREAEADRYPDILDLDPRFATLVGFANFCAGLPEWPPLSFYGFELHRIKRGRP